MLWKWTDEIVKKTSPPGYGFPIRKAQIKEKK
jgi:hypothetical protein